jgi:hypothetical protein
MSIHCQRNPDVDTEMNILPPRVAVTGPFFRSSISHHKTPPSTVHITPISKHHTESLVVGRLYLTRAANSNFKIIVKNDDLTGTIRRC